MNHTFLSFWSQFGEQPLSNRREYFESMSKQERANLIQSFYQGGWHNFFATVYIDYLLDEFKATFDIDLIDLRIKAIKHNKVFLIDRDTWEYIQELMLEFNNYYDSSLIFGGLKMEIWGKKGQFYKIKARKLKQWR